MQILKMANTNMTIFGDLGSETPQSFGTQIYLYPIMQVLGFYYLFTDQRNILGRDKLLLKCVSSAGSCCLLSDHCRIIGGDELLVDLLSPWLGLAACFQTSAG